LAPGAFSPAQHYSDIIGADLDVHSEETLFLHNVVALMQQYRDTPMSVADVCLVRMSELRNDCLVFSTDSDFHIYHRHRNQVIPAPLPPA
jgi:hypothetical protein